MPQPVNGRGAVDLGAVKAQAQQREQIEEHRAQLVGQLLVKAGLVCPCGERIRSEPVTYFALGEQQTRTPQGPRVELVLRAFTFHSRACEHAIAAEQTAIARRRGAAGEVTWLDEQRATRERHVG